MVAIRPVVADVCFFVFLGFSAFITVDNPATLKIVKRQLDFYPVTK